ncbi:hypothetical protein SAMN05444166_6414 [Singulisphaera sp. GP187]|nr:hypothetical protein SAMN05444166_6414 [Singulisphaera sp. GP187]
MAGLKTDSKGNKLITFWYDGKQFPRSADTKDVRTAEASRTHVEHAIFQLTQRDATLPDGHAIALLASNCSVVVHRKHILTSANWVPRKTSSLNEGGYGRSLLGAQFHPSPPTSSQPGSESAPSVSIGYCVISMPSSSSPAKRINDGGR